MLQATEDKRKEKRRQKVCVYYMCTLCPVSYLFFPQSYTEKILELWYQVDTKINVVHGTNMVKTDFNFSTRAGIMLSTSDNLPLIPMALPGPP